MAFSYEFCKIFSLNTPGQLLFATAIFHLKIGKKNKSHVTNKETNLKKTTSVI